MNKTYLATWDYFFPQFASINTPDKPINMYTIFSNPAMLPRTVVTKLRFKSPTSPQLMAPTRTRMFATC